MPVASYNQGAVVIIDTVKAAVTAAALFEQGAKKIFAASCATDVLNLQKKHKVQTLVTEYHINQFLGNVIGNSPKQVIDSSHIYGRSVILYTSSGTFALRAAISNKIYFLGFPTFTAQKEILKRNNEDITLIALDGEGSDDHILANCMAESLIGNKLDMKTICSELLERRLCTLAHQNTEDLKLCLTPDHYKFGIQLKSSCNDGILLQI